MLGPPNISVELNSTKKVRMQHTKLKKGAASVEIQKNGVIYASLSGHITEKIARNLMADTKVLVDLQRSNQQPALLLIDVTDVTGQDSAARSAAKQIADFQLDKIAVCGKRLLKMIGQYILRSGGMGDYSKVFSSPAEATSWLLGTNTPQRPLAFKQNLARLLFSLSVLTPLVALVGWIIDRPVLTGVYNGLQSMNPVVAITLVALSIAGMLLTVSKSRRRQQTLLFLCCWSLFFSVLVLIRAIWGIDTNIDTWILTGGIADHSIARASPMTGIAITAIGLFVLAVNNPRKRLSKVITYVMAIVLLVLVMSALVGYCYNFPRLYTLFGGTPMAVNTMITLFYLVGGMFVVNTMVTPDTQARKFILNYWPAIFTFVGLSMVTGFAWQQSIRSQNKDQDKVVSDQFNSTINTISNRGAAYISTLRDYKAFFASSSSVNAQEFDQYGKTAELSKHYPGVIGISFIKSVPQSQKATFEAQVKKEQSPYSAAYTNFTIHPNTTSEVLFPLLLVSPLSTTSSVGFNLASDPVRLQALEKARDSGDVAATATINLNAARGGDLPTRNGFFISIPIYNQANHQDPTTLADRRAQLFGTVNAYVEDKLLFNDILKNTDQSQAHYVVRDAANGQIIYESSSKKPVDAVLQAQDIISIAGQRWRVQLFANNTYGVSETQRNAPLNTLIGGIFTSALIAYLVASQTRRRQQAYELASNMTEDLQSERNRAVTLQQKDEAVLASIGDAVFAIDTKGIITLFNKACVRISGYEESEAIGKHYADILNFQIEATGKPNDRFIKEALAGKITSMKDHTILVRKDGYHVQVADSAAPIYDLRGKMQGVIVVFRDVSKEYELDKAKTEFVSLASHQLRTPLSAINWYAEMLLDGTAGKINKDATGYIREIYEGNQRMVELVNSLLDVSRLDLGKLTNNPQPTSIEDLITSLERELQTMISSKQIDLTNKIEPKLTPVAADPKLLRMIVQNLLSNAVKYTHDKGTVAVTLRDATLADIAKSGLRSHAPSIFLSVSDNGYGIPEAQQPKIFSKLFRADNVRILDVEGTGLGLYIVKEVVQKLGGKVWFESKESVGTTFYVIMPYKTKHTSDGATKQ